MVTKVSKMIQTATVFSISNSRSFLLFFLFFYWRISYIIYPLSVDLDSPSVDRVGHYLLVLSATFPNLL